MLKKITRKISNLANTNVDFFANRNKIPLSLSSFNSLSRYPQNAKRETAAVFNGHSLQFGSPYWFLHSVKEIFVEEVYLFPSAKKNPYIIDCGSNIGLSIIYFKKLFPEAKVLAFEADPSIFQQLQKNIAEYRYNDVTLVNSAVWKENGVLNFHAEGSVGGAINFSGQTTAQTADVPAIRLKDYLTEEVDFLKIDIEGAEYEVLKDCKEQLRNVKNFFVEYHEEKNGRTGLHEILQWVHDAGFRYYLREAWNNMSYPFSKKYNDCFHSQLNIFCFRS